MSQTINVVFAVLFIMVFIWFALVGWLFHYLRKYHPPTYESIGSPTLFWNNSPRNNWLFLKFLFGSQCQSLNDPRLITVCWFMRVFICVYFVGFILLSVAIIWRPPQYR